MPEMRKGDLNDFKIIYYKNLVYYSYNINFSTDHNKYSFDSGW